MRSKLVAVGFGIALACGLVASGASGSGQPTHPCRPWRVRPLLTGQGWLESLAFDGHGGMTISALSQGRILRLTRHGRLSVLLDGVNAPGGEIIRGGFLYFTTGNLIPPDTDGTIARLDLHTGKSTTWATGLTMPNGLAFLPGGDAVVTRDAQSGPPATDVTRIPARNRRHPRFNWIRVPDSNGIVVDPSGHLLYLDGTKTGLVYRASIAHPRMIRVIGRLGATAPDDMTIDTAGVLYIAGFGKGKVYRLDPRTQAHARSPAASAIRRRWYSADADGPRRTCSSRTRAAIFTS